MEDMGLARGLITVVTLATFLGICWWAYRPASRDRFEADGMLVFDEGEHAPSSPEAARVAPATVEAAATEEGRA